MSERSLVERLRDKANKMPKWEGHRCVDAVLMLEAAAALAQWEEKFAYFGRLASEQYERDREVIAQWEARWRELYKLGSA